MRYALIPLLVLLPILSFAQYDYLGISNPDRTWDSYPVNIHESVFEIHDKGTFSEVELFISFAASDSNYFSKNELLEMFSFFHLDDAVTVSDLWLWWGDELMIAHIIDRWTANRVYESIVDRQQDPAILYKDSPTSYEMRVYPFSRGQIRKLKISFLIPNNNIQNSSSISLPTNFHELAEEIVEDPIIRYFSEEEPEIAFSNGLNQNFTSGLDSLGRRFWQTTLDATLISPDLKMNVQRDGTNEIYLSSYTDTDDKYYSLSFTPKDVLEFTASKKVLVMIDYAGSNTSLSKTEIIQEIRTSLKEHFDDIDRFNFLYSTVSEQVLLADNWLAATDSNIDSLFDEIDQTDILSVSNLDDILIDGINFINDNGAGELLLITSSDSYNSFQDANSFIESVIRYAEDDLPKITILDIQNQDIEYNYRNGIPYRGNDYLNGIIVRESGGELINYQDHQNLYSRFTTAFNSLQGSITNYTIYATFDGGFSYANFTSNNTQKLSLNSSFIQVGKYYGDLPMNIQFTGSIGDTVFNKQLVVNESTPIDSSLKRYWVGRNIDKLEKSNPSNEEIATIIGHSMDNRLMSQYTSFLAILPEDTVLIDQSREEDGGVINSTDESPDTFKIESLTAYPNPFNPNVNIEVKLSEPWDATNSKIVIYNMIGQKVATLNTSQFNGLTSFTVNWDVGLNNSHLATGVYLVSVQTPNTNKKIKITYLK